MFKITYVILISCVVGLFSTNPVLATDDFVFTISSLSEFEEGQYPFVNGKAFTLDKNPVSDVQIQVNFSSETIKTSTNSTGQFSVTSLIPAKIGESSITVYATKDDKFTNAEITYQGIENKPIIIQDTVNPLEKIPNTDENIELDPFSKMIKQLEEQKTQVEKKKTLAKEQQQVDEQRLLAETNLQKDLELYKKQQESHSPRNAFLRFLTDIDSSFKSIFWQQFLFTEKITDEAREAKENALEEGKSSADATKIFQQEAAVTQNEITEYIKNLNIKHGNATSSVQEQFNEEGKILREE